MSLEPLKRPDHERPNTNDRVEALKRTILRIPRGFDTAPCHRLLERTLAGLGQMLGMTTRHSHLHEVVSP
jgi:hypothetical protein